MRAFRCTESRIISIVKEAEADLPLEAVSY